MKVVVGASSFADANDAPLRRMTEKGIEVVKNPYGRRLTEDEIIEHLQGADGLLAGLEPLNENVFSKADSLKAIARIGIGMDNVDKEAAKRHGIKVSNTPDGPTEAVSEMTLTAMLAMFHNIIPSDRDIHGGTWKKRMGLSIYGAKVFVVGYGHIGKSITKLLKSMGADVKVYDKYADDVSDCTMEEGLSWADAVTIHVSGNDEIIGKAELGMMKDGAFLLNSSRGALINEEALYENLKNGKLAGFWGDALWQEPYEGKIAECENAVLTPHICTYTKRCRESMEMQAVENLLKDLKI